MLSEHKIPRVQIVIIIVEMCNKTRNNVPLKRLNDKEHAKFFLLCLLVIFLSADLKVSSLFFIYFYFVLFSEKILIR